MQVETILEITRDTVSAEQVLLPVRPPGFESSTQRFLPTAFNGTWVNASGEKPGASLEEEAELRHAERPQKIQKFFQRSALLLSVEDYAAEEQQVAEIDERIRSAKCEPQENQWQHQQVQKKQREQILLKEEREVFVNPAGSSVCPGVPLLRQ